jgi:hypothetical protein
MHSYLDRLDFGFIVDRELVPDVWDLADLHIDEIARLFEATGAEWAQPPEPAFPRRGPIRLAPAATPKKSATTKSATNESAAATARRSPRKRSPVRKR